MISQELLDYIKHQQQLGKSKEEITSALIGQGWQAADVEHGFTSAASGIPAPINTSLPKAKQIFKEAWVIYKARFKTLIAISLIPVASLLSFAIIYFIYAITKVANIAEIAQKAIFIALGLLTIVDIIFIIYVFTWSGAAQLSAIKDSAEGIGWKEAFNRSKNKIGIFFTTGLLTGLAIFGGFILFVIPGIIFAFWFSQTPYIVVEEGIGNTAALKRSKYYIKGRIGQAFGKLFYIGIITFLLSFILGLFLAVISAVARIDIDNISWIKNIFSIIWAPLEAIYGYLLYKYLKTTRP